MDIDDVIDEKAEAGNTSCDEEVDYFRSKDINAWKFKGHIELKDLKEKDFLELIESKNSDKRFYCMLHFNHPG